MQGPAEELVKADGEPAGRHRSGHRRDLNSLVKKYFGTPKRSPSPFFLPFFFFQSHSVHKINKKMCDILQCFFNTLKQVGCTTHVREY